MSKYLKIILAVLIAGLIVNLPIVFAQELPEVGTIVGDPAFEAPAGPIVGDPAFELSGTPGEGGGIRAWAISEIGQGILAVLGKVVGFVTYVINYFIGYIAAVLFTLGGFLIKIGLTMNSQLIDSPTVAAGWVVTRDLANLGFVLSIIVIAFATILRQQSYALKQTLWKLVVVALLVNFSLVIAGVFIDLSGVISNLFISKATQGNLDQFANALASSFGAQQLMKITADDLRGFEGLPEFGANMFGAIASLSFVSLFTVLGAIALLGVAAMLFIRYIALTILLILMPLAWLFWIFPNLASNWSKWWSNFMKWVFFMPAATFFLYLTILLVHNQAENPSSPIDIIKMVGAGGGAETILLTTIANPFETFARMVVILGLLVGGLIAANSFGIYGAGAFMSMANGVKGWAIGQITATGGFAGRSLLRAGSKIDPATGKATPSWAQRVANNLIRVPGLRGAATGLSNLVATSKKGVEGYAKEMDNWTPEMVTNAIKKPGGLLNPELAAALASKAAKFKLTDKLYGDPEKITDEREKDRVKKSNDAATKAMLDAARKMGTQKDILENRLDLGSDKEIADILGKMSPRALIEKVDAIALKDRRVFEKLTPAHREFIAKEGSRDQVINIAKVAITLNKEQPENEAANLILGNSAFMGAMKEAVKENREDFKDFGEYFDKMAEKMSAEAATAQAAQKKEAEEKKK